MDLTIAFHSTPGIYFTRINYIHQFEVAFFLSLDEYKNKERVVSLQPMWISIFRDLSFMFCCQISIKR